MRIALIVSGLLWLIIFGLVLIWMGWTKTGLLVLLLVALYVRVRGGYLFP